MASAKIIQDKQNTVEEITNNQCLIILEWSV